MHIDYNPSENLSYIESILYSKLDNDLKIYILRTYFSLLDFKPDKYEDILIHLLKAIVK